MSEDKPSGFRPDPQESNPSEAEGPNNVREIYKLCEAVIELAHKIQRRTPGTPVYLPKYNDIELDMYANDERANDPAGVTINLKEIPFAREFLKINGESVSYITIDKHIGERSAAEEGWSFGDSPYYQLIFSIDHEEDSNLFMYYFGANGMAVKNKATEPPEEDMDDSYTPIEIGEWEFIKAGVMVIKERVEDIAMQEGIV